MPMKYEAPLRDLRSSTTSCSTPPRSPRCPASRTPPPTSSRRCSRRWARSPARCSCRSNGVGDEEGCKLADGKVKTPTGFPEAWNLLREGGWMGLTADPEHGGQGMPYCVGVAASEPMISANLAFAMYVCLTHGADRRARSTTPPTSSRQVFLPQARRGELGGHHVPHRATGGYRPGAGAHQGGRRRRRRLPRDRAEDLHLRRRPRSRREHRPPGARAAPRRSRRASRASACS